MSAEWLEEIRRDNTSGAAALAARAAQALAEWVAGQPGPAECLAVARGLMRAQPRMAPLVNLAHRFLEAGPNAAVACRRFIEELQAGTAAAARHAAALIPGGAVVLTHSFSSTVLGALRRAKQEGRDFSVIATESRPMCEGVALARELAAAGVEVRLIVDAAAALLMGEARLVLLGADAVTGEGVINKVGSRAIALAAREHGVPVYALATGDKLVPSGYRMPPEPAHPAYEVFAEQVQGISVLNYYFEETPLDLFTGIVSEDGLLAKEVLVRILTRKTLHPALREAQ